MISFQPAGAAGPRLCPDLPPRWPERRADMTSPVAIRERMAEDLGALIFERGDEAVILTEDYLRLGWTRAQVDAHALAAACRLAQDFEPGAVAPRDAA